MKQLITMTIIDKKMQDLPKISQAQYHHAQTKKTNRGGFGGETVLLFRSLEGSTVLEYKYDLQQHIWSPFGLFRFIIDNGETRLSRNKDFGATHTCKWVRLWKL